ncbi:uncharacterized protein [Halyomorpha halys]|uniref:uncharacterized protein n=1 Tax=Halyomorpha halys TaxID=286706 RepID=UPI0006D51474|nr:uncharacterized protein LOC106682879 [Halyomorpha halys]XP_014279472.1 uncharacterized protein LOC106682879 [Halyomorpha halys]
MHIARLKSLWNELNNDLQARNENVLPDLILVWKTLNILPNSFISFKSSWMLLKSEDTTFEDLTVQLCTFERNFMKQKGSSSVSQEALAAVSKQRIGQQGKSKSKNHNKCNYCKQAGHWVRICEKWISDGRPKKNQEASAADSAGLMLVEVEALSVESSSQPSTWWIDNGATRLVTNTNLFYIDFEKFESPLGIKSAGKEILPAIGTRTVKVKNFTTREMFLLKDVLYVPNLCRNLFLVLAAQDKNPTSVFESTATQWWLSNQGKLMLYGTREHGGTLYKVTIEPVKPNPEVNIVDDLLQLYHQRWGHQDNRHVQAKMVKELNIQFATGNE